MKIHLKTMSTNRIPSQTVNFTCLISINSDDWQKTKVKIVKSTISSKNGKHLLVTSSLLWGFAEMVNRHMVYMLNHHMNHVMCSHVKTVLQLCSSVTLRYTSSSWPAVCSTCFSNSEWWVMNDCSGAGGVPQGAAPPHIVPLLLLHSLYCDC